MGTSKRDAGSRKANSAPGPNAYSPRLTPRSGGYSFGTQKRSNMARAAAGPGPGAYSSATSSIGKQTTSRHTSAGGVKFGTSERTKTPRNSAPGAGQYSISESMYAVPRRLTSPRRWRCGEAV